MVATNWANVTMALHHLVGLEDRLKRSASQAKQLFVLLNELPGLKIRPVEGGTNVFVLELPSGVSIQKLRDTLLQKYNILIPGASPNGASRLVVNESFLSRSNELIVTAFKESLALIKA